MALSAKAENIISQLNVDDVRMGDIRKLAAEIKINAGLAKELWQSGDFGPRLLAILIMDKSQLTQDSIEKLVSDMSKHEPKNRDRLSEWFLANQLMKSAKTKALIPTWENHPSPTLRRLFWYHQARLRWTGQKPPDNSKVLFETIQEKLSTELPEVQWTMNFCAAQIGIHEAQYREQCIELGERVGLYKEEKVPRNCTPNYLPKFIEIEVAKRQT